MTNIQFKKYKVGDYFDVINNPQLDKENFVFIDSAEYPYFTRTENNNGILGYVEYLDEEHKIQGNTLAVGMISKRFHYMNHDFYAGQFTKTVIPKFDEFDELLALYFITVFNKLSRAWVDLPVRFFKDDLLQSEVDLPVGINGGPDWNYMKQYIKNIEDVVLQNWIEEKDCYLKVMRGVIDEIG